MKPDALDDDVFSLTAPRRFVSPPDENTERVLTPDIRWMADIEPQKHLTFVGLRIAAGGTRFALVLECSPEKDRLALELLESGEDPIGVLAHEGRRAELRRLLFEYAEGGSPPAPTPNFVETSVSRAVSDKRLGPPVPVPHRIYGVAANFPSHLEHDLAVRDPSVPDTLARTRPRVFIKYPPTPPPDGFDLKGSGFAGIVGPFDGVRYPRRIEVPSSEKGDSREPAETRVDYEVEVGIVMGQALTGETVRSMDDDTVRGAVAGYLLAGDTKARNPQVLGKIASIDRDPPMGAAPYLVGDPGLDEALGYWDPNTAQWWSYAASWGDYASLGPFFVAASRAGPFPDRAVIAARSYAPGPTRGAAVPPGRATGAFYVRQASIGSERAQARDRMIWSVPQVIRSILAPDSALGFAGRPARLMPGDVICLGTPGGTIITAKPHALVDFVEDLVFWRSPRDWHDAFFRGHSELYLRDGDEVFYWAAGLGFQRFRVEGLD